MEIPAPPAAQGLSEPVNVAVSGDLGGVDPHNRFPGHDYLGGRQSAASGLDAEKDVLFVILTSHGSPDGLAIKAGRLQQILTPAQLSAMLAKTGVRHKVVVISACYSGVFIPRLANPDVLVITAADANHSSFGCQDKARWTYFGDAFFNVALRHPVSLTDAFLDARSLVRKRELREHFEPSNPQMAGGANVLPLLIGRH